MRTLASRRQKSADFPALVGDGSGGDAPAVVLGRLRRLYSQGPACRRWSPCFARHAGEEEGSRVRNPCSSRFAIVCIASCDRVGSSSDRVWDGGAGSRNTCGRAPPGWCRRPGGVRRAGARGGGFLRHQDCRRRTNLRLQGPYL